MREVGLLEEREKFGRETRNSRLAKCNLGGFWGNTLLPLPDTESLILPHPERAAPEVRRLQPDSEVEAIAMRVVMEYEKEKKRQVYDVHEKNLGYDLTSLDLNSGELRLIEVKGLGEATGNVLLTPNEKRVAEDRRDCYWLYVVTNCKGQPKLQNPIKDPARLKWHEVKKVDHYYLSIDAVTQPMEIREEHGDFGK